MKRIKTLTTKNLKESMKKGGCGECQTSCQSACKTSCTVEIRAARTNNQKQFIVQERGLTEGELSVKSSLYVIRKM